MRSLVFSLIFLGFFSAQGQVFSELEFKLQQKDFKSLLKQSGLLDSAISLDKELNFALNGSEMSFKKLRALGDINIKEVLQKEEGFQLQALSPQFSLLVEDFRLRTFKKITVGKVSANIRIELHCPVARAQFKGLGAAASLSFPWKVKNLDLDLDSQKLSIDLSQCQGTKGLEGEIQKEVMSLLKDPSLLAEIEDSISEELMGLKLEKEFEILEQKIRVSLKDLNISEQSIYGKLKLEALGFDKEEVKENLESKSSRVLASLKSDRSYLSLPMNWIYRVLKEMVFKYDFESKEYSMLDMVFAKRWVQFFIWPDLLRFKNKQNFKISSLLKVKEIKRQKSLSNELKLSLNTMYNSHVDFKTNRVFPYVDLLGFLKAGLRLKLSKEKLSLKISSPKISGYSRWDSKMSQWRKSKFSKNGLPRMYFIFKKIESFLTDYQMEVPLPFKLNHVEIERDRLQFSL